MSRPIQSPRSREDEAEEENGGELGNAKALLTSSLGLYGGERTSTAAAVDKLEQLIRNERDRWQRYADLLH